QMQDENVRLHQACSELDTLRAEIVRLERAASEPAERLRKAQAEVTRLRGESVQLRQQLKDAQTNLAARTARPQSAPASNAPDAVPGPPVETFTAVTRATLLPRQTLVTGGWSTPDGKRALFLIEPEIASQPGEPGQITLRTRIVEMPDAVLTQLGLDALRSA